MSVRRASVNAHMQRACAKHPQKTASHQLTGKQLGADCFYCQKCSIMLASQGYNVVKLAGIAGPISHNKTRSARSSYQSYSILSNRKTQISNFIEGLQMLNGQLNKRLQQIQEHLIKSQTEYGRMIQETNKFYAQIQETIELQKYTTYNSILNKRSVQEGKIRENREVIFEAADDIVAMLTDIRQNMDAVETVDYSIYNTIMGGYQTKLEKIKSVTKQNVAMRSVQKLQIVLPDFPKNLLCLSERIEIIGKKSVSSTIHNSINSSVFQPRRIMTEDDEVVFQSDQFSPRQPSSQFDSEKDDTIREDKMKQNSGPVNHVVECKGKKKELAFSFDQHSHNQKQVKICEDSNVFDTSNLLAMQGFEQEGKLSKIEERMNNKEVCESRESLGEYLNISQSRQRHFLQDTQTLLIV